MKSKHKLIREREIRASDFTKTDLIIPKLLHSLIPIKLNPMCKQLPWIGRFSFSKPFFLKKSNSLNST